MAITITRQLGRIDTQLTEIRDRRAAGEGKGIMPWIPRIMFLHRAEYLRMVAFAFVGGFFGHVLLEHSAGPRLQRWIEMAVVIITLIAAFTGSMSRRRGAMKRP
jgi:hypothetical protein